MHCCGHFILNDRGGHQCYVLWLRKLIQRVGVRRIWLPQAGKWRKVFLREWISGYRPKTSSGIWTSWGYAMVKRDKREGEAALTTQGGMPYFKAIVKIRAPSQFQFSRLEISLNWWGPSLHTMANLWLKGPISPWPISKDLLLKTPKILWKVLCSVLASGVATQGETCGKPVVIATCGKEVTISLS